MKIFPLLATFLVLALAYAEDCSRTGCGEGECCVLTMLMPTVRGKCKKINQEGDDCFMPDKFTKARGSDVKVFHFECPCVSGLACEMQDYFTHGPWTIGTEFKCVVPSTEKPE